MSTTHYPKPTPEEYADGAERVERQLQKYLEAGAPSCIFDDIIVEAMRRRAQMFRELAERNRYE